MTAYVVKSQWGKESPGQPFGQPLPIFEELRAGRARIGWSYLDNLDLRLIQNKIQRGEGLVGDEQWAKRCRGFLTRVNEGDYLVYPNQPKRGYFSVVKVTGEYDYSPEGTSGVYDGNDFRSFRPCQLVTPDPVNMYDGIVPSQLRRRLGVQGRFSEIWDTRPLEICLKALEARSRPDDTRQPPGKPGDAMSRIDNDLRKTISDSLHREFSGADLSRNFCRDLFEHMGYSSEDIHVQEGRGEAGSDIVVTVGVPYLLPESVDFQVGVQVFSYEGSVEESALQHKLKQLLGGWEKNSLDYGVLLTTGRCSDAAHAAIERHNQNDKNRLVRLIDGDDLADLFRQYFLPDDD